MILSNNSAQWVCVSQLSRWRCKGPDTQMTPSRHLSHSRMSVCLSATLLGRGGYLHNIDLQWPNWAKSTGCPVKFEFQINNKYNFSIDMSHAIFETYLHWKENLLPSGHPTEIPRSPSPVGNIHIWKHCQWQPASEQWYCPCNLHCWHALFLQVIKYSPRWV